MTHSVFHPTSTILMPSDLIPFARIITLLICYYPSLHIMHHYFLYKIARRMRISMRKSVKNSKMFVAFSCLFFIIGAFAANDTISPSQSIREGEILVSANGSFELGFFSPDTSAKRYLGIWYKAVSPRTFAWVANRETPLTDHSGVLNVNSKGIVLLDGRDRIVWSHNTSKTMENPVMKLLESGNLILKDGKSDNLENLLWQSFDHPCDTLLLGMKIGRNFKTGKDRYLSAWKSKDDPAPGQFSLWIDPRGFPQFVLKKGSAMYYRAGSWNGLGFTGTAPLKEIVVCNYKFVQNEDEVYYECDADKDTPVSRLWVSESGFVVGSMRSTILTDGWLHGYLPSEHCDLYSLCGAHARCMNNTVCACLEGFVPKSPKDWSMSNWSKGCVRERELNCENGDEFQKYVRLKLPDTSSSRFNKSMTLKECKETCLRNCSCTAYANSDIRGSGCLLWFGDLVDMRGYNDGGQDLYIRMAASKKGQSVTKKQVAIIITSVLLTAIFIVALILYIRKKKLKKQGLQQIIFGYKNGGGKEDMELWKFDFARIAKATGNFSSDNKLGEGGFGPVYKGTLIEGQEIAVKRLSKSSGQGMEEFKNEVTLIAKLQHRNLVKLLGCCIQADEIMLIYEYMPNKSLDLFIFDPVRSKFLDWQKRILIIGGIARGILYLHQDSRMRVIHRDLKANNVLLDSDMNPKISDFGMARIFGGDDIQTNTNKVVGTYGYMSPEYAAEGLFSVKSDIFSFGVLVLEIVSGQKNWRFSHPNHDHNLLGHAWILWKERRALELAGDTLDDSYPQPEVLRCIHVGLLCVQQRAEDRPNMSSVVLMLGSESSLPEPKQPGFFTDRSLSDIDFSSRNPRSSTTNDLTITELEAR